MIDVSDYVDINLCCTPVCARLSQRCSSFKNAIRTLPQSVLYDPLSHIDIKSLAWSALIELDLINEDQDGVDFSDRSKIIRWLRKWSPDTLNQR